MSTQRVRRLAITLTVGALVMAACGGDDLVEITSAPTTASTDATPSPTVAPPTTAAASLDGEDRSAELLGRWEITAYVLSGNGGLTNVLGEDAHLDFLADGTLEYGTGCNSGSTSYATSGVYLDPGPFDDEREGQPISIGPDFAQTESACDGFLGEQDVDIPLRMMETTRFFFTDATLILADEFIKVEGTRAG